MGKLGLKSSVKFFVLYKVTISESIVQEGKGMQLHTSHVIFNETPLRNQKLKHQNINRVTAPRHMKPNSDEKIKILKKLKGNELKNDFIVDRNEMQENSESQSPNEPENSKSSEVGNEKQNGDLFLSMLNQKILAQNKKQDSKSKSQENLS